MAKTKLYIARHGKTMFNTIGRAQGWSDSPLTEAGERGIHELGIGLRQAGIQFQQAVSSDSGLTIQTMGIVLEELGLTGKIPYRYDKRIREWCFGSFDGAYDGELFMGVLPRVFRVDDFHHLSLMELSKWIQQAGQSLGKLFAIEFWKALRQLPRMLSLKVVAMPSWSVMG